MEELRFVTLDEVPRRRSPSFPPLFLTVLPRSIRVSACYPGTGIFLRAFLPPDFGGKSSGISPGYDRLNSSISPPSNGFIVRGQMPAGYIRMYVYIRERKKE